jgi:predicted outer membrane repeat protein
LTVTDCTFSGNSANHDLFGGGGIYNAGTSRLRLRNTLVAENSAQSGGPDVDGALTSFGHNLIGIGDGGSGYASTDLVGTSANPIDPKLGPLQDNGGPTWTLALLPGSPAIGAGALTDMEWDQRGPGYARSVNGTTDIGAYEIQPSGAGSAALTLHSPEPLRLSPEVALSKPSTQTMPLRQAADAVDRVFASGTTEATNFQLGRSGLAALGEPGFWPIDFMLAV